LPELSALWSLTFKAIIITDLWREHSESSMDCPHVQKILHYK